MLSRPGLLDTIEAKQIPATISALALAAATLGARMHSEDSAVPEDSNPTTPEQYLTVEDVADMLSVQTRWVRSRAEQLGGVRLSNKTIRFPRERVRRYIARRQI